MSLTSSQTTLVLGRVAVFSKTAAVTARICLQDAGRDTGTLDRRVSRAVGGRRHAVHACEARRERANAAQADHEADVGNRAVGVPQQFGSALEPAREQVLVGSLAEGSPELPAEVGRRQVRNPGKRRNVERLSEARVGDVLGAQQVSFRRDERHVSLPVETRLEAGTNRWARTFSLTKGQFEEVSKRERNNGEGNPR